MSMPAEELIANPDLAQIPMEAGFRTSVDMALIDEEMAEELTEPRLDLKSALMEAVARARPSIGGWARAVSVFGGSGGDGLAGGTVKFEIKSASPRRSFPRWPGGPGTVKYAPPVPSVP